MSRARFGHLMKRHRETSHLSQEMLAQKTRLSRNTISLIERGAHMPTLDTLDKLQRELGFSMNVALLHWRLKDEPSAPDWEI